MTRIAILDDYQSVALQYGAWDSLPPDCEVVCFSDHASSAAELVARLRSFDVVLAMRERSAFPREVLEQLPELRLIVTAGMRNAVIDIAAARELGITVCGTGATNCMTPTPELTWGLILAVLRHIPQEVSSVRSGGWQQTVGGDLAGATLGLAGLGNMGELVAKVGQAFGMQVVAWSQNLTPERCGEVGVELVSKEELLRRSDVLSIHLQLSPRTLGVFGAKELAQMKPTAILVNTSRGPIVDEAALIDALRNNLIAGAAVDVYETEPLAKDHPFRSLPTLVATPHSGYVTHNCYTTFYGEMVEDVVAFVGGEPIRVLDPA